MGAVPPAPRGAPPAATVMPSQLWRGRTTFAPLAMDLPPNVHMLSLFVRGDPLAAGTAAAAAAASSPPELVLRLNNVAENCTGPLARQQVVDVGTLFKDATLSSLVEKTLSLQLDQSALVRRQWPLRDDVDNSGGRDGSATATPFVTSGESPTKVALGPIQLKSFTLQLEGISDKQHGG